MNNVRGLELESSHSQFLCAPPWASVTWAQLDAINKVINLCSDDIIPFQACCKLELKLPFLVNYGATPGSIKDNL